MTTDEECDTKNIRFLGIVINHIQKTLDFWAL